jgi:hypothetical protein
MRSTIKDRNMAGRTKRGDRILEGRLSRGLETNPSYFSDMSNEVGDYERTTHDVTVCFT